MNKWYVNDRIRKTYKAGERTLAVYWNLNSANGIAWDKHSDRIGEPIIVDRLYLVEEGYVLDAGD